MLGFVHSLLDQVKDKAGWDEGHGENHADSNHGIHRRGQPAARQEIQAETGEEGGAGAGENSQLWGGSPSARSQPPESPSLARRLSFHSIVLKWVKGKWILGFPFHVNVEYCSILI